MNSPRYTLSALVTFAVALTISGCGTGYVNSVSGSPTTVTSPVTPQAAPVGLGVQDYGGHAPLVGAHIYLVQLGAPSSQVPSGTTQTYGSVVKSLLTQNGNYTSSPVYSGTPAMPYTYPLTQNVNDQFVPATDLVGQPFKYVTTNQYGESYITGDYTCNAGYPVMLIGYGGLPSYYGAGPNTVNVTSAVIYKGTVGGVSGGIITYQTSSQLFYTGESISTSITGANSYYSVTTGSGSAFSGSATSGVLSGGEISGYTGPGSPNLTSTQFSVFIPGYGGGTGSPGTVTGTVTGTPAFNPAATNMAMLGLCPSSGNFSTSGNGALNYIYMNEVSTTVSAYSLAGFVNTLATGQSGYDEFHIGAPVGNLAGLQNAAVTAGLLYDIQGSNSGSTSFDGENHTARTTTPGLAAGAVPNQQINMIANSLAACVDSANTYYWNGTYVAPTSTNQSTACKTLGQYAEDNGYVDTTAPTHYAFNIAQAAFSLARFPEGLGTATTSGGTNGGTQTLTAGTATTASNFVSAIFNLPAGSNVPFAPALTAAPNDLSIPIQWTPDGSTAVTDVEIDGNGIAYAMGGAATNAGASSTKLFAFAPSTATTGATLGGMNQVNYTAAAGLSTALTSGLAIDASNNVWVPGLTGIYKFTPGNGAGVLVGAATNSASGGAVSLDSSVNQYIPSGNDGAPLVGLASTITKQSTGGAVAGGYPIAATSTNCANSVGWTTLDSAGNLWTATSQNNTNAGATVNYVCRFPGTGGTTPQYTFALPNSVTGQAGASLAVGGFSIARGLATDMGDNAWFAEKNQDALYVVAKGTTAANTYSVRNTLHGQLSAPRGVAVDGANTIWVSSTGDTTATVAGGVLSPKYGTGLVQFNSSDVVITPNYITGDVAASSASNNTSLASVAIDPSGNIWSAQGSQTPGAAGTVNPTKVYEYVGLGAPTTTPIVVAKVNKTTGVKAGLTSDSVSAFRYPDFTGSGTIAIAFSANQSFYVGEQILLSGFGTSTYLNGHKLAITALTDGTDIRAAFIDGYTPTMNVGVTIQETGLVTALN